MPENNNYRSYRDALAIVGIPSSVADEIVDAIWFGTAKNRNYLHAGRCPSSAGEARTWLDGAVPPRRCVPCYDQYSLIVSEVCSGRLGPRNKDGLSIRDRLAAASNPAGYVRVVARTKSQDELRAQNVRLNGPAKFDDRAGVAGRVRTALADPWLDELFVMMRKSVVEYRAVSRDFWPYARFAAALSERTGAAAADALSAVRHDVGHVLSVTRRVAGDSWAHDNFEAPRLARQELFAESIYADGDGEQCEVPATSVSTQELVEDAVRGLTHRGLRQGNGVRAAVLHALAEVAETAVTPSAAQLDELCVFYLSELAVSAATSIRTSEFAPTPPAATAAVARAATLAIDGVAGASELLCLLRHALSESVVQVEEDLAERVLACVAEHVR